MKELFQEKGEEKMDIVKAENIVNLYGAALASRRNDEYARKKSLLPASKGDIVKAFKLLLAHYIQYDSLTQEIGEQMVEALVAINIFVDEATYIKVNSSKEESVKFMIGNMRDGVLFDEINDYIDTIQSLDRNDPLYLQKVYTYADIEYIANVPSRKTFWAKLLGR